MALTLDEAQRMIRAGIDAAQQRGLNVSIAVTDASGWLIAAARMDRAGLPTPEIAFGKAAAAALFRRSGAELASRWGPGHPVGASMTVRMGGRFVPSQGGLPIREGDQVVGGVGVSGATSQEDEEVAMAALAALSEQP